MPSPGTNDTAKDSGSKSNEAVTFGKAKRRPVAAVKGSPPPEASPKPKMKRAPDQAMAQTVKPTPKRMAPKKPAPFRPSPTVAEPVSASSPAEADKSPYRWDTRFTLALIILVVGINLTLTLLFGRHDDVSPSAEADSVPTDPQTISAPAMNLPASEDAPGLMQAVHSPPAPDDAETEASQNESTAAASEAQAANAALPNAALLDRLNAAEPSAAPPPAPRPAKPALDTKKLLEIINRY